MVLRIPGDALFSSYTNSSKGKHIDKQINLESTWTPRFAKFANYANTIN